MYLNAGKGKKTLWQAQKTEYIASIVIPNPTSPTKFKEPLVS